MKPYKPYSLAAKTFLIMCNAHDGRKAARIGNTIDATMHRNALACVTAADVSPGLLKCAHDAVEDINQLLREQPHEGVVHVS